MTPIENPIEDIMRFAKSRSWFKHLSYEGTKFVLFPKKGIQPINSMDRSILDPDVVHWWIWELDFADEIDMCSIEKTTILSNPIIFNCFLRGAEKGGYFSGWSQIRQKYPKVLEQLSEKYPETGCIDEYLELDHKRQINKAVKKAVYLYNFMVAIKSNLIF